MWEHCLKGLESDPMTLGRECDWVTKHQLIEGYRARHGLPLGHPKVALLDLQYHDVNRTRGLYYRVEARDRVDRITDDATITEAMNRPPADHPGPAARGVHPQGQGTTTRLHGGLGPPQAERSGPDGRCCSRIPSVPMTSGSRS